MQKVVDWLKRFGGWLLLAFAAAVSLYYRRTERGAQIIMRAREMRNRALSPREQTRGAWKTMRRSKEIDAQLANLQKVTVEIYLRRERAYG